MLCSRPFIKDPTIRIKGLSYDVRDASTPFPCGQCINCRINKSRLWSSRMLLQRMVSGDSAFVTLTYNDEFVPEGCDLYPKDVTNFLKRIRNHFPPKSIKYYYAGEYGSEKGRPHYHVALFGVSCGSESLIKKCWTFEGVSMGRVHVGELTMQSARYISGYIIKGLNKYNQYSVEKLYRKGVMRRPEFQRMSKGLGKEAVEIMGENLVKAGINKRVKEWKHGGNKHIFGRYLQSVIDNKMGISEEERVNDFMDYQDELLDKYMDGGILRDNILEDNKQKRLNQEKRSKIFNKRRKL